MGHMSQHRVTRDTSGLELQTNVHTKVGNHGDEPSCGPPFEALLVTPRDTCLVTTTRPPWCPRSRHIGTLHFTPSAAVCIHVNNNDGGNLCCRPGDGSALLQMQALTMEQTSNILIDLREQGARLIGDWDGAGDE